MKTHRQAVIQGFVFSPGDILRHKTTGHSYVVNEVSDFQAHLSWDRVGPVITLHPSYTIINKVTDTISVITNWHADEYVVTQGVAP